MSIQKSTNQLKPGARRTVSASMKTEVMQPVGGQLSQGQRHGSPRSLNRSISVPASTSSGLSITDQLANFSRTSLKPVETKVTYTDGRCEMVELNRDGTEVVKKRTSGELGFVGDMKEDLQVAEVLPGLIMGSQDVAHNVELLTKYGVTHVLNVATLVVNMYPYKYTYKDIEILDIPEAAILPFFNEAFKFIDEGRMNGCVLVHCNAGVSRSAAFVIGYLMRTECMTFQDAYDHLKALRPATQPNPGFVKQLQRYEDMLQAELLRQEKYLTRSPPVPEKKQVKYQKKANSLCEGDLPSVISQVVAKSNGETEKVKKQGFFKRLNSRLERFRSSNSESHVAKSRSECEALHIEPSVFSDTSCSSLDPGSDSEDELELQRKKNQPNSQQRYDDAEA